jgi:hypothetical protein
MVCEVSLFLASSVLFAILPLIKYNLRIMNLKLKKKPKDWSKLVFSAVHVAAGRSEKVEQAFHDYHTEMSGQAHDDALFKSVDGTETYYLTPSAEKYFLKYLIEYGNPVACERPDKDSVTCVSGSSRGDYDRFWE